MSSTIISTYCDSNDYPNYVFECILCSSIIKNYKCYSNKNMKHCCSCDKFFDNNIIYHCCKCNLIFYPYEKHCNLCCETYWRDFHRCNKK